ncbi:MAG TPA: alpha/beta hydrolase-fold protein [Microvirga sp.]
MRLTRALGTFVTALMAVAVSWSALAGTVISQRFPSQTLGRDWVYNVYLPDGYDTGKLRYPVMYLLHGNGGDENEWVAKGEAQRTIDRLIADGQMPPAVIVLPSATTTWYVDRKEPMETAFMRDLMPEVERKFRVINDRMGRVIGGVSMGGYGSLRFALKNPEMFAAVALVSPAIYVPEPPETSSARRVGVFGAGTYDPEVWKQLNYPTLLDAFLAKKIVMPVHFSSGDHDEFQIEYHATNLYKVWRDNKIPAELRVIDGGHNWDAFKQLLPDAMRYVFQTVRRPELVNGTSQ